MRPKDFAKEDPKERWQYEPKPPGYARRDEPPVTRGSKSTVRHVVRVARADRRLAEAEPEAASPNLTGRYQNAVAAGLAAFGAASGSSSGAPYLVHLNHVGKHLEGLLVDLSGTAEGKEARTWRFGGDQRGQGFFHLYVVTTDEEGDGHLEVQENGITVTMKIEGGLSIEEMPFSRREQRATFLDKSIEPLIDIYDMTQGEADVAKKVIRDTERVPLSDSQLMELAEHLSPEHVRPLLATYHDQGMSGQVVEEFWRAKAGTTWDDWLGELLSPQRWSASQRFAAMEATRQILSAEPLVFGKTTKAALQWVEDMVGEVFSGTKFTRDMPHSRELLGIDHVTGLERYKYEIKLTLKHKGLGSEVLKVGAYYGTLTVTSDAPSWRGMAGHKEFPAVFTGVGVIASKEGGEAGLGGSAKFTSYAEWTPDDFPGIAMLGDGGIWAGKEVLGRKFGKSVRSVSLKIMGRGEHPHKDVDLENVSGFRKGVGGEATVSMGWIFQSDDELKNRDFTRKRHPVSYFLHEHDQRETHFRLGSALLLGLGRQQVRVFAAEWLPWFGSLSSTLEIVGYADTVDRPERNQELSLMRAQNVKQALVDILGDSLTIPLDHIKAVGRGDVEAAAEDPDETPNRRHRRVDILLNGHCVLSLWTTS